MSRVRFNVNKAESLLIHRIAQRIVAIADKHGMVYEIMDAEMDVTACHRNGCPLRLNELLAADDADFGHDVFGIHRYLDQATGTLTNCFVPRYAEPQGAAHAH